MSRWQLNTALFAVDGAETEASPASTGVAKVDTGAMITPPFEDTDTGFSHGVAGSMLCCAGLAAAALASALGVAVPRAATLAGRLGKNKLDSSEATLGADM